MSFKLVVWDFDGTLADSLPAAVGIFNRIPGDGLQAEWRQRRIAT